MKFGFLFEFSEEGSNFGGVGTKLSESFFGLFMVDNVVGVEEESRAEREEDLTEREFGGRLGLGFGKGNGEGKVGGGGGGGCRGRGWGR